MVGVNTVSTDVCSVCVNVWWQIEGAGRLRGPMTPPAPVAAAERERRSQIRPALPPATREKKVAWVSENVTLAFFSLSLSLSGLVCPPHLSSHKRRLVSHRRLLPQKLCSSALNCFCVTERERGSICSQFPHHISSQEALKRWLFFFPWISNHSDNWAQVIHPLLFSSQGINRLRFTQSWRLKSSSWGLFFLHLQSRNSTEVMFKNATEDEHCSTALHWREENDSLRFSNKNIYSLSVLPILWHALVGSWEPGEFQPWWKSAANSRVNRARPNRDPRDKWNH